MYDVRRFVIRSARAVGSLAVATALVLAVLPVAPAYAPPIYGGIWGGVDDASTFAMRPGIKVQAFTVNSGTYTPGPTAYTDANGYYSLVLLGGASYRIVFTDPTHNPRQVYADSVYVTAGHVEAGADIPVTAGIWSVANGHLQPASAIQVDAKRSGQWATPLKGMVATVLDATDSTTRRYTTNSDGSVRKGGVPAGSYHVTISDPSGKFGTVTLPAHTLGTNDDWTFEGALPLVHPSANIAVSKPSSKGSVKHGVKLSVSGTLSKQVTSPKTMRLDGYQWSPSALAWVLNNSATLKIAKSGTKSAYSGSIKFPHAGTWRIVAIFTGNSTYAQSGSYYKGVTVN